MLICACCTCLIKSGEPSNDPFVRDQDCVVKGEEATQSRYYDAESCGTSDTYQLAGRLLCEGFGASEPLSEEDVHTVTLAARANSFVRCSLREGDAVLVPYAWWHGTCNLHNWNAGFTWFVR